MGYATKASLTAGKFYLLGAQFQTTSAQSFDLQTFITGDFAAVDFDDADEWLFTSPRILIYDVATSEYSDYYYQTDAQGTGSSDDGWVNGAAEYAENVTIAPGSALWFICPNANCSVTFSGQVIGTAGSDIDITGGTFNMIANPFPVATTLNGGSFTMTGIDAVEFDDADEWLFTSPRILIYDAANAEYADYYYQTDAEGTGSSDDGWVNGAAEFAEGVTIPAGDAFWFWSSSNGKITFNK